MVTLSDKYSDYLNDLVWLKSSWPAFLSGVPQNTWPTGCYQALSQRDFWMEMLWKSRLKTVRQTSVFVFLDLLPWMRHSLGLSEVRLLCKVFPPEIWQNDLCFSLKRFRAWRFYHMGFGEHCSPKGSCKLGVKWQLYHKRVSLLFTHLKFSII